MLLSSTAPAGDLAIDSTGNVFVIRNHAIVRYAPDGSRSVFAGGLRDPQALCFDHHSDLFVSEGAMTDSHPLGISKITPDGKRNIFAAGLSAAAMAVDRADNLLVAHQDSIFKFSPAGAKSTLLTLPGANFIGLAFDGTGNLFVADQAIGDVGPGRGIFEVSADGTRKVFADGLDDPSGLAADNKGNVYVVQTKPGEPSRRVIFRWRPDGTRTTFAPDVAGFILGLAADSAGNVFAANDQAVLKFDANGAQSVAASDLISPDKKWEFANVLVGTETYSPEIFDAESKHIAIDLDEDLDVSSRDAQETEVVWAPDSKRFACNYSPPHAHHTSFSTVALYQLGNDGWKPLRKVAHGESLQLAQLGKGLLPRGFNPHRCLGERDIVKAQSWSDANTLILYAPCGGSSGQLDAGFLFTLQFDEAGNWKVSRVRQMSKDELEQMEQ